MVCGRSASFRPTSHLLSPTTSTASTTTSSQPPAFFRSHPHRHHHHDNTIYCKSTLLFCLKVLLKAVLPSHCYCRLDNSPCFGVESRYSPPVPEPTSWPRLQLLSPSIQASEAACFTSPKWQLLHHLQRVPTLRQLLSTAHGTTPTNPILLVDLAA